MHEFPLHKIKIILQFGVGFHVADGAFEPLASIDDPPEENKGEHNT